MFNATPGDCSPSRSVVSKMITFSAIVCSTSFGHSCD
jgi:hypothetical protein